MPHVRMIEMIFWIWLIFLFLVCLWIVCASVSCPDLRNEAFVANPHKLNHQMNSQMKTFLENTDKGLNPNNLYVFFLIYPFFVSVNLLFWVHQIIWFFLYRVNGVLFLSPIFRWFASDFGNTTVALLQWRTFFFTVFWNILNLKSIWILADSNDFSSVARYTPPSIQSYLMQNTTKIAVHYFNYDWRLNGEVTPLCSFVRHCPSSLSKLFGLNILDSISSFGCFFFDTEPSMFSLVDVSFVGWYSCSCHCRY
jgi:hypothetical protein